MGKQRRGPRAKKVGKIVPATPRKLHERAGVDTDTDSDALLDSGDELSIVDSAPNIVRDFLTPTFRKHKIGDRFTFTRLIRYPRVSGLALAPFLPESVIEPLEAPSAVAPHSDTHTGYLVTVNPDGFALEEYSIVRVPAGLNLPKSDQPRSFVTRMLFHLFDPSGRHQGSFGRAPVDKGREHEVPHHYMRLGADSCVWMRSSRALFDLFVDNGRVGTPLAASASPESIPKLRTMGVLDVESILPDGTGPESIPAAFV